MSAVTPGQAAYEAYVMAAPDDMNFPVPDSLDAWERDAWEAAGQAAYEQRAQNDAAAHEPHAADGLMEAARLAQDALHDIAARCASGEAASLRDIGQRALAGLGLLDVREPQPAPELAAAMDAPAALARVLSWFAEEPVVSSRRYASATRAQLAHAYQDGGLTVPEDLRRFL